jgi:hypothetical protein
LPLNAKQGAIMTAHAHKAFSRTAHSHQDTAVTRAILKLNPAGETIELRGSQYLTMREFGGWTVRTLSGTVWLTQDGDVRDVVLEAGQDFTFDRDGTALLNALGEARIRICRNGAASQGARRPSVWRGILRSMATAKALFA